MSDTGSKPPSALPSSPSPAANDAPADRPARRAPTLETYDIRIAADGTWFHNGRPIRRPALVKLFASVLSRAEDGTYWLRTPAEYGEIQVEDAPFLAIDLEAEGEGQGQTLHLTTNIGERVTVGRHHPLSLWPYGPEDLPVPYVALDRGLSARLDRAVTYALAEMACPAPAHQGGETTFGVWSQGLFFPLGQVFDEEAPG